MLKIRLLLLPSMVKPAIPLISKSSLIVICAPVKVIVSPSKLGSKAIVSAPSLLLASITACLKEPAPLLFVLVTNMGLPVTVTVTVAVSLLPLPSVTV